MRLVGLTGGIGSGKSTVARMLAERGAEVIDADAIAREVLVPGSEALDEVVAEFGDGVVDDRGELDRQRLAEVVFNDDDARSALNAIVHPRVGEEISQRLRALRATEKTVVIDVPLLVESDAVGGYEAVIVVAASESTRIERLVEDRGMDAAEVRARIAAQATDEERLAVATHVVPNDGSLDDLKRRVDEVWAEITSDDRRSSR